MENQYSDNRQPNPGVGPAQKLMFFMIGGGIGAVAALLFAPKSGAQLRSDIAGRVDEGYGKALVAASEMKDRTCELYEVAKGTAGDVLEVMSSRLSEIENEVLTDVEKVSSVLQSSPICGTGPDRSTRFRLTETGRNIQEGAKQ